MTEPRRGYNTRRSLRRAKARAAAGLPPIVPMWTEERSAHLRARFWIDDGPTILQALNAMPGARIPGMPSIDYRARKPPNLYDAANLTPEQLPGFRDYKAGIRATRVEIMSFARLSMVAANHPGRGNSTWTEARRTILRQHFPTATPTAILAALNASPGPKIETFKAVQARARREKLTRPRPSAEAVSAAVAKGWQRRREAAGLPHPAPAEPTDWEAEALRMLRQGHSTAAVTLHTAITAARQAMLLEEDAAREIASREGKLDRVRRMLRARTCPHVIRAATKVQLADIYRIAAAEQRQARERAA
jgi:hypothetical protein